MALRRAGKGYVLGVKSSHTVKSPSLYAHADEIAQGLPASAWKRNCAGEGTQGPRLPDWAYLRLIDQEASDYDPQSSGLWTRGLLIRRRLLDGELAYFSTWAPQGTSMETLAHVEGHRWSIEQSFEAAKGELGLDHNETRSWYLWSCWPLPCWPRYAGRLISPSPKNDPAPDGVDTSQLIRWSLQEIRRVVMRLTQKAFNPDQIMRWSIWRRRHQALAQIAHTKRKSQL